MLAKDGGDLGVSTRTKNCSRSHSSSPRSLVKASVSSAEQLHLEGDAEIHRLYEVVFGEQRNSELEDGAARYQASLLKSEYPNGGKLRDYQAEGVSWLISNYVNKRSSILADEMGKFGAFVIP
jgi:SNF2 family DNA or RNA helicase